MAPFGAAPFIERIKHSDAAFRDAMEVRTEVFCKEQGVPQQNEEDEYDPGAVHWVVYASVSSVGNDDSLNNKMPVGTIRMIPPAISKKTYVLIGRLAVLKPFRSLGLAKLLVDEALGYADIRPDGFDCPEEGIPYDGRAVVHAQTGLKQYWERYGFIHDESVGNWDEEGIDHIFMWKPAGNQRRQSVIYFPPNTAAG